jgi:hypothetical protein
VIRVARVRHARRCRAHRKNGEPCKAFAIVGGFVCRMHGGATRQARYRAVYREAEASCLREFEAARARWREDMVRWQAGCIIVTAKVMGIPVERVTRGDVFVCRVVHGVPDAPQPVMRRDRRYGRRPP